MPGAVAARTAGWDRARNLPGPLGSATGIAPAVDTSPPFPQSPLRIRVEAQVGGTWTGITSYVYSRDRITITRGRSAEAPVADPSSQRLTLNNRDGRFSNRNPVGPWYGLIGRNTPMRTSVAGLSRVVIPGGINDIVAAPHAGLMAFAGDIDVRLDARLDSWWAYLPWYVLDKGITTAARQSWGLLLTSPLAGTLGTLTFAWSTDGTDAGGLRAGSTAPLPMTGRLTVRATLDVDNGAGGWTCTFYTGTTVSGPWTQLGDPVTGSPATSVFVGTADVRSRPLIRAEVYAAQVRNGISGTAVVDADFTAFGDQPTSVVDAAGNTWTPQGAAQISTVHARATGEVAAWPQRWDATGRDVYTPVQADGVLRRLGQGASPLKSSLYRAMVTRPDVVAYWPAEDGEASTQIASALGGRPMSVSGTPGYASASPFAGSGPLPNLSLSRWTGPVPAYPATGEAEVRFILSLPAAGVATGTVVAQVLTSGGARRWDVVYTTAAAGTLALKGYDSGGSLIADSGAGPFAVNGDPVIVVVRLAQDGADVDYEIWSADLAIGGSASGTTGTLVANTGTAVTGVVVNPGKTLDDTAFGQVAVESAVTGGIVSAELAYQVLGWDGEPAAARVRRLCDEEGIPVRILGFEDQASAALASTSWQYNPSAPMGPQTQATLLTLLRDAAETDQGVLFEPRDSLGLAYRIRASLYNRPASLTLDYPSNQLASAEPTDDDAAVRNDITVTRAGGSSARAEQLTGSLNVQDPSDDPQGVGRYDVGVTINTFTDAELPDHAGWRRHLGTVDEARWPAVGVNLAYPEFTSDLTLTQDAADLDVAERFDITNPPAWLPPEDIALVYQGATETLSQFQWDIALASTPESPWRVAVYDADLARYSSDGSTVAADAPAGQATLTVATPVGPVWSHADGDFDMVCAGERVTVTAVTGAASPQTFTVTRAVNGVAKTLPAGAAIELAQPAVYAL